jgi:hypothetical protein
MKATINGKTYFASWRHETKKGLGKNANKSYEETTCVIRVLDGDNIVPFLTGTARQNFIDAPNRPFANHLTLVKALGVTPESDENSLVYKLYCEFADQLRPVPEHITLAPKPEPPFNLVAWFNGLFAQSQTA